MLDNRVSICNIPMITNGESKIKKWVCYCGEEKVGSPYGACREYLIQLNKDSGNIEILTVF